MSSPLLLSSLSKYFTEHPNDARMLQKLVDGTYPVSLRVIDWFITHYSKQKNVLYWIDDRTNTLLETQPAVFHSHFRKVHLYYEYRAQLKSYTKLLFDPFRRHDRISFIIEKTPSGVVSVETTTGQLNFFRWAIQTHVLDYIQRHLADIEESMILNQDKRKKRSGGSSGVAQTAPITPTTVPLRRKASIASAISAAGNTVQHTMRFD